MRTLQIGRGELLRRAELVARNIQRPDDARRKAPTGENMYGRDNTYGGYSDVIVVNEDSS